MPKLSQLSLLLLLSPALAAAEDSKIELSAGYFSINAKASGETAAISNPSVLRAGYLRPVLPQLEFSIGYTLVLADFSGSDLGYGVDLGANYYPFTASTDEVYRSDAVEARAYERYKPYVGLGFYQRQFQSIKNSYAGFGLAAGVERYVDRKINLKAEGRYINLAGSSDSTATELDLLVGIVFKI